MMLKMFDTDIGEMLDIGEKRKGSTDTNISAKYMHDDRIALPWLFNMYEVTEVLYLENMLLALSALTNIVFMELSIHL